MNSLELKFLGSGGAFCKPNENFHSNILLTRSSNKRMLFDCGSDIKQSLHYHRVNTKDIDAIYITHDHGDHTGGLEYIGFDRYFNTYPEPIGSNSPDIFAHEDILIDLWENTLRGGMESLQGRTNKLEDYFNCNYIEDNGSFEFEDIKFNLIQVHHVTDNRRTMPAYGLMFCTKEDTVFITGDCTFDVSNFGHYDKATKIFQEVEFADYENSVHSQFRHLCTLDPKIKSKMWLYHYSLKIGSTTSEDGYEEDILEDFEKREQLVIDNGFAGLIKRGQTFNFKI